MSEIREYRGQRVNTNEWVYGMPVGDVMICGHDIRWLDEEVSMSQTYEFDHVEVIPSTVGQAVGKEDKDKNKIFAGDYLGDWYEDDDGNEVMGHYGVVTYYAEECRWILADENGKWNDWTDEDMARPENWDNLYTLGSIHDNPKLLEVGE